MYLDVLSSKRNAEEGHPKHIEKFLAQVKILSVQKRSITTPKGLGKEMNQKYIC